ncbi:MAG: hypothetical protein NTX66_01810 [Candidatus Falkowbacteria bacterium]|nr:hypothetical protein [Candidatus Falkowbacteria bacterium]
MSGDSSPGTVQPTAVGAHGFALSFAFVFVLFGGVGTVIKAVACGRTGAAKNGKGEDGGQDKNLENSEILSFFHGGSVCKICIVICT